MHRAFRLEAENVWVPVISKQAGAAFLDERPAAPISTAYLVANFSKQIKKKNAARGKSAAKTVAI